MILISLALAGAPVATVEMVLRAASGRDVPVRLVHPPCTPGRTMPFIVFSHGANSSPAKYDRLTGGWAARGYLVAAPLHADSPEHPNGGKLSPADSWSFRIADMRLMLDRKADIERASGCRPDLRRVAAAGHSYGALIAQVMGGARRVGQPDQRDRRIKAVVAFSPPGPIPNYMTAEGWAGIAVPMFVQTGTADLVPPIAPTWQAHKVSWTVSRTPGVLFVGAGADHYFGNRIGRPERPDPPPSVLEAFDAAVTLSADFLDWTVRAKAGAAERLAPEAVARSWSSTIIAEYQRR